MHLSDEFLTPQGFNPSNQDARSWNVGRHVACGCQHLFMISYLTYKPICLATGVQHLGNKQHTAHQSSSLALTFCILHAAWLQVRHRQRKGMEYHLVETQYTNHKTQSSNRQHYLMYRSPTKPRQTTTWMHIRVRAKCNYPQN